VKRGGVKIPVGRVLTKEKFRKPCWDVMDILDRLRAGETCESLLFLPAVLGGVEGRKGVGYARL
jgi:hypothetical protein